MLVVVFGLARFFVQLPSLFGLGFSVLLGFKCEFGVFDKCGSWVDYVDFNLRVRKLKCCVVCFESLLSEMPIRA